MFAVMYLKFISFEITNIFIYFYNLITIFFLQFCCPCDMFPASSSEMIMLILGKLLFSWIKFSDYNYSFPILHKWVSFRLEAVKVRWWTFWVPVVSSHIHKLIFLEEENHMEVEYSNKEHKWHWRHQLLTCGWRICHTSIHFLYPPLSTTFESFSVVDFLWYSKAAFLKIGEILH